MTTVELEAFEQLFKAVCAKCFGQALTIPLTEPESRHLSNEIEEKTGLVVGWKSLKNYSVFVLNPETSKPENPSTATLDTLARYLVAAPATTEVQRKRDRKHFMYWFRYLNQFIYGSKVQNGSTDKTFLSRKRGLVRMIYLALMVVTLAIFMIFSQEQHSVFSDNFKNVDAEILYQNDWLLLSESPSHWQRRGENNGNLTLFTLKGDNWVSKDQTPRISNLLVRRIQGECFDVEVHFADFIPKENWQQAGLLLLEDTTYLGKSLRLSLAFNNFFGGFEQPDEIIVQGVADFGKNSPNVEEVQHHQLFSLQEANSAIVHNNLRFSALRIEKRGKRYRFLYAASPIEHFYYKELDIYNFDFQPNFVGIFALKGFVESVEEMPVKVRYFRLERANCGY
ncbi:MAG TPA: hypothetical protein PKC30_08675 [Saprospiraceae bacterium]|nr:hypothetical protein [Saprospiraceae bacterium]